jgi:hypothetical protein
MVYIVITAAIVVPGVAGDQTASEQQPRPGHRAIARCTGPGRTVGAGKARLGAAPGVRSTGGGVDDAVAGAASFRTTRVDPAFFGRQLDPGAGAGRPHAGEKPGARGLHAHLRGR